MSTVDKACVPRHIALIMDGNGRWASSRGLARSDGHRQGVKAIEPIVEHCIERGIDALTLFAFSTENWSRPQEEITGLMGLLKEFFDARLPVLIAGGVRVRILGERKGLPAPQRAIVAGAEMATAGNGKLSLNVAFNYGAHAEIVSAARELAQRAVDGDIRPQDIDAALFESCLHTKDLPSVDMLIRTGGEMRISNFLLYQLAYAELFFVPEFWPDFTPKVLDRVLDEFSGRKRRFGGV